MRARLKDAMEKTSHLESEVSSLTGRLEVEVTRNEALQKRVDELWKSSCSQMSQWDAQLTEKDEIIARLQAELARSKHEGSPPSSRFSISPSLGTSEEEEYVPPSFVPKVQVSSQSKQTRRVGRAPPIDPFTGEEPTIRPDDWIPALERASKWNGWSAEEKLLQLAGHLRGRALEEWNLLSEQEASSYRLALANLRERLDPGSKVLAGQDFRHARQNEGELVSEYIRRLERAFQIAFGRDRMSTETRDAILYGQLQEGLRVSLMKSPSVSGALSYKELCMAAKNEEKTS